MSSHAIALLDYLLRPGIGSVIAGKRNHPCTLPTLIAGVCVIGLTTGVPLFSQSMSYAATSGAEGMVVDGDRPQPSNLSLGYASTQQVIQPLRRYEAPDGLGLPTRREPGGTR